jgi:hypothetical protein
MNCEWYEVWIDEAIDPPYVLLAIQTTGATIRVTDPKEAGKVVFESEVYEVVKSWLLEDEYRLVAGRTIPD